MTFEKMTYSYRSIFAACDAVKAFTWNVSRKNEHFAKWADLKKLYSFCFDCTRCTLFNPDWDYKLENYGKAAYNFKSYKKADLDFMLNSCRRYLQNELNGILTDMKTGDVNAID